MLRGSLRWVLLGCFAATACSGRYTQKGKGGADDEDGSGSKGGSDSFTVAGTQGIGIGTGGSSSIGEGAGSSMGATSSLGAASTTGGSLGVGGGPPVDPVVDEVPQGCLETGPWETPKAGLVAPREAWRRVSSFVWGGEVDPPDDLPMVTTASWMDETLTAAFAQSRQRGSGMMGGIWFVRKWLGLGDFAPLERDYARLTEQRASLVPLLIAMPLERPERVGVFGEPSWLVRFDSITKRGTEVCRALLGEPPPPPPNIPLDLDPTLPERQALAQAVANPACLACHQLIDPLGVALLNFDHLGKYRTEDKGQVIDASGTYMLGTGELITFADAGTLMPALARSCDATRGFADAFLRMGMELNGVQLDYDELQLAQLTFRQALSYYGRDYEGWVKAYAQTSVVLLAHP